MTRQSPLREAVEQLANLGEKDPYEIADKLIRRNGDAWAVEVIDARSVIASEAKYVLGLRRRGAEARATSHLDVADQVAEVQLQSIWIDGKGYVREADLTSEDCRIRAEHHRKLALWNQQKAEQYDRFADAMDVAQVERLGDLIAAGLAEAA